MNWYYASAGKQVGPISQDQFNALLQAGTVSSDTLVWREGMANWQPHRMVAGLAGVIDSPGAPSVAGAGSAPAGATVAANSGGTTASSSAGAPVSGTAGATVVCAECGRTFPPDEVVRYGAIAVCANCKPIFLQKLREGVAITGAFEYGGFWIRFAALIVDNIILLAVGLMINLPLSYLFAIGKPQPGQIGVYLAFQVLLSVINMLLHVAYDTWFVGRFGATPGKMACKLKIITADGGRVSYSRALGRSLAKILSGLILCIGYLMAAFDDQKRALHDRICDTRVIKNG